MRDIKGQELAVGDEIAVAFTSGRSACLRIGRIQDFVRTHDYYGEESELKILVEWSVGWHLPDKPTVIECRDMKIVRL